MAFKILRNFLRRLIAQSLKYYQKIKLFVFATYRNAEQKIPSLLAYVVRNGVSACLHVDRC